MARAHSVGLSQGHEQAPHITAEDGSPIYFILMQTPVISYILVSS